MRLPDLVAYQAAVQHPSTAFADPQLRAATAATGQLGLPRAVAGNFAVTYQLRSGQQQWAVRCFHREVADRAPRYAAISRALAQLRSGPLVPIEYVDPGVRVGQAWYPITKMAWIEGYPLNRAVEASLSRPSTLRDFERRFVNLVAELRQLGVAHGDLQHGNILVEPSGSLRLVDYDGMFVPALRGRPASECGDPNYQHPRRGTQFDADLDRFAALVIVLALRALAAAPRLWHTYNTGDNLLFTRADFGDPVRSALFGELSGIADVRDLAQQLASAAQGECARVPLLQDVLRTRPAADATPRPLKAGHVAVLNRLYGPQPRQPRASGPKQPRVWKLRRATVQQALAFSADASLVVSGERNGRITIRDAASGRTRRAVRLPRTAGNLRGLAFSAGGRLIAVVEDGPDLGVWDVLEGRQLHDAPCGRGHVRAVAVSADGGWLAAATADGMLCCWRLTDGRLVTASALGGACGALAITTSGRHVATAGARGAVHIRELPSGRAVGSLAVGRRASCLAFTAGGSRLAVATAAGHITLWEVSSARRIAELASLDAPLECLALSDDARALAAASHDGTLWLRRLAAPTAPRPLPPRTRPVASSVLDSGQRLFDWLRRVALL